MASQPHGGTMQGQGQRQPVVWGSKRKHFSGATPEENSNSAVDEGLLLNYTR